MAPSLSCAVTCLRSPRRAPGESAVPGVDPSSHLAPNKDKFTNLSFLRPLHLKSNYF